jgi:hypothetical protein
LYLENAATTTTTTTTSCATTNTTRQWQCNESESVDATEDEAARASEGKRRERFRGTLDRVKAYRTLTLCFPTLSNPTTVSSPACVLRVGRVVVIVVSLCTLPYLFIVVVIVVVTVDFLLYW